MTAAIYFEPEGYTTRGPRLMGRQAAGESFLRGFFMHGKPGPLWMYGDSDGAYREFEKSARRWGRPEPIHSIDRTRLGRLEDPGALYLPGPGLGPQAWFRQQVSPAGWSLCGITHTTASAGAMDSIIDLITSPVKPWDALICTSNAVRSHVEALLDAQEAHLRERLGATRFERPQMPVIPLGIHTADFEFDERGRTQARRELGIEADTLVVLFVGRLSFHAKAHPLPMYLAMQRAAKTTGRSVVLVECGWFANEALGEAFDAAARQAAPDVRRIVLDGRESVARTRAWAAADVFCSLSDNIQETFGLVPLEAMAAALPVVVSDWDGYRETVRDGIDGFRIPTTMPPPGAGQDLARRHALGIDSYDRYCGYSAAFVVVDVDAATVAFERLFTSPDLRRSMGQAGRQRARELFDWQHLIPRYEALWDELEARRVAGRDAVAPTRWPARLDPYEAFQRYPSHRLVAGSTFSLAGPDARDQLGKRRSLMMVHYAQALLPSPAQADGWINRLEAGPATVVQMLEGLNRDEQISTVRGLLWLAKLGVVRLAHPPVQ